ncbi:molecular chaperone DnaJ [Streptacidiphilus pinicola]|uniref:Molecular chaperone DnaJ n=1 Tax=Streptacidiphilus pinicola TaxID=2219663 RepID=A0A2X0IHI8_9ACTN|nr:molecular chaperone DnaJ [Streptacidiphilus pinicola]RAG83063.1 molecular chaperone DnaJ [Streptacidiphilus pinicola]
MSEPPWRRPTSRPSDPPRPRTFDEALAALAAATSAEDVFGAAAAPDVTARRYRRLARLLHPDTAPPGRRAEATAACASLNRLRAAQPLVSDDLLTTRHRTYQVGDRIASGDVALLRAARTRAREGRGPELDAVLKTPYSPADNDLMEREAHALAWLARHGEPRFRNYVPTLLESFTHADPAEPGAAPRRVNALLRLDGFLSLAELRDAFPDGLDPRDAAWIWRRLLVALGHAHRTRVRHGAVLPEHVLIHPVEHGLVLVDWCYATTGVPAPAPALVERHRGRYPPEVAARRPVTEATDIHLASSCIAELMGDQAPSQMRGFLAGCMLPAEPRRPHDAWRLLAELDQLLERLYGPRTFRPLRLPAA